VYPRYSTNSILQSLDDTPVVFIMGPRQVGKTTLVKSLIDNEAWEFISFDDLAQYKIAKTDPMGFIRNLPQKQIALDEVQRIPELFVAIKQAVDEYRTPGKFLLTGSTNALLLPRLSDSLAGRMESIKLNALSECEINKKRTCFLDKLLKQRPPTADDIRVRGHLIHRLVTGCFPVPLQRTTEKRSSAWYKQYTNTLIQRDIQDFSNIDYPELIIKLLNLTAYYSGKLVNYAELGSKIGLNTATTKKYLSLLEHLFLVEKLPAWHTNEYKRLIKTPKIHMVDTGMICAVRGISSQRLIKNPDEIGSLLESFVYNELRKQSEWIDEPIYFYHYRDKDKVEVDIIIENGVGDCFAIEVKAGATITTKDFTGLKRFQNIAAKRFKYGILLYDGEHTTSFGDNLYAVPLGALWSAC